MTKKTGEKYFLFPQLTIGISIGDLHNFTLLKYLPDTIPAINV